MCNDGWGTEGWGVHPPPLPTYPWQAPPPPLYPQQQLAFGPRLRVRPTQPPYPPPDQFPGIQSGFRQGFNVGRAEGYQARQQDEPELRKGTNKYTRAASSDWWESDDHGGSDAGDKKTQKRNTCRATEWSKQYHKDSPVDPEKFPRVEF